MTSVKERFIKYVQIETKSNRNVETCPSSPGQFVFARKLVEELKQIGLQDVTLDDNCYVMATLPSNVDKQVPVLGLTGPYGYQPGYERRKRQSADHPQLRWRQYCAQQGIGNRSGCRNFS